MPHLPPMVCTRVPANAFPSPTTHRGPAACVPSDRVSQESSAVALSLHRLIIEGDPQLRTLKSSRHDR